MRRSPKCLLSPPPCIQDPPCSTLKTSTSTIFPARTMSLFHRYTGNIWFFQTVMLWTVLNVRLPVPVQMHSGSSEAEEENEPDGAFAFRRKAGCVYHSVSFTADLISCCFHTSLISFCNCIINTNPSKFMKWALSGLAHCFACHKLFHLPLLRSSCFLLMLLRPVRIRAAAGPGAEKRKEDHVTRGSGTPSPLSPFPAAVSGWHGDGWDEAAG